MLEFLDTFLSTFALSDDEDEEETGAGNEGATEGTATTGAGALATASLWPPSTTASVIATPAVVRTPPATTAPARKLTSSMRA